LTVSVHDVESLREEFETWLACYQNAAFLVEISGDTFCVEATEKMPNKVKK